VHIYFVVYFDFNFNEMVQTVNYFHAFDYVVFASMLIISALIGIYFAYRGQHSTSELLTGNRSMGVMPVSISLFVTFLTAISLIGDPAEMYEFGTLFKFVSTLSQPLVIFLSCYFLCHFSIN
jgi:sodium-coupled monocarboxylate transporter 8/12